MWWLSGKGLKADRYRFLWQVSGERKEERVTTEFSIGGRSGEK
jgi:hypothetical protein